MTINKRRIKKMVETAIASRIKAGVEANKEDYQALIMWGTPKNESVTSLYTGTADDLAAIRRLRESDKTFDKLYGNFMSLRDDISDALNEMMDYLAAVERPTKSIKGAAIKMNSEVGDIKPLSQFDIKDEGDGNYRLVQADVDMLLEDNDINSDYGYMYAIELQKNGEQLEIWVGNSLANHARFERVL